MDSRDTQFRGFAKALFDELPEPPYGNSLLTFDDWSDACEKTIAQRAYDLVVHCLATMHPPTVVAMLLKEMPDLIKWVKE